MPHACAHSASSGQAVGVILPPPRGWERAVSSSVPRVIESRRECTLPKRFIFCFPAGTRSQIRHGHAGFTPGLMNAARLGLEFPNFIKPPLAGILFLGVSAKGLLLRGHGKMGHPGRDLALALSAEVKIPPCLALIRRDQGWGTRTRYGQEMYKLVTWN
jgi:hypothetical protein